MAIPEIIKEKILSFFIGIFFMVIAIIIQSLVQNIPLILLLYLHHGISESTRIINQFAYANPVIYAIFIGGTAAAFQESFKYIAVDTKGKQMAFWIGLGFSLVDIIILYTGSIPLFFTHSLLFFLVILNTVFSLLFHPGTAMFLKAGILKKRGKIFLSIVILLHGIVDGSLVFTDIFVAEFPGAYLSAVAIFWISSILISIFIFILGRKEIMHSPEEKYEDLAIF